MSMLNISHLLLLVWDIGCIPTHGSWSDLQLPEIGLPSPSSPSTNPGGQYKLDSVVLSSYAVQLLPAQTPQHCLAQQLLAFLKYAIYRTQSNNDQLAFFIMYGC